MRPEPSVNFLNISCKIKFYQQLAEFQDYEQKLGEESTFAKIIFYSFQIDDNYCKSWAVCHLDKIFTRLNFPFSISSSHEACKKRCMEPAPESPPPAKCPIKETIKPGKSPVSESMIGFDSICMTCTLFGWAAYALQLNHGDSKLTSVLLFGSIPTFLNHNLVLESQLCL